MQISEWLTDTNQKQAYLARIIETVRNISPAAARVRAHRLAKGAKPDDDEMLAIFKASDGRVTGNDIYDLPILKQTNSNSQNINKS